MSAPACSILLHSCRTCGAEWSQLGYLKTSDCLNCIPQSTKAANKTSRGQVDKGGVLVRPVEPVLS